MTMKTAVLILALAACLGGVWGGPALGDHEAIVAQSARDIRRSGDWLVPQFLETPFIRKSPLPFWMVAGASYLFGNDPATGLPVTAGAARLPSALCAFGSILLLWHLGSRMFGPRAGLVTAVVVSTSVAFLLYAPNATAEMPLTFCCVWAYYHFWFAATGRSTAARLLHSLGFYLALGFAMLAKGPAPVALVGFPLAVWWYVHRPLRLIARNGAAGSRRAMALFLRDFLRQTAGVFTRLWFIPGIALFAMVFVPWMLAVADRYPHAWDLWNWQFLQRAKGDFPDTRHRSILYYLPIVGSLVVPWTFLVLEAAAAPWMRRYARYHRPLLFAGLWVLLGTLSMSLMEFKKPYYILPAVPGLILLVAFVADRLFFAHVDVTRFQRGALRTGLALQVIAGVAAVWMWLADEGMTLSSGLVGLAVLAVVILLGAAYAYRVGRRGLAFATVSIVTVAAFHSAWHGLGGDIDNVDKVAKLAATLEASGVPRSARVFWADRRPDARLSFYFDRRSEHMVKPEEIVSQGILNRETEKHALEQMAIGRAFNLLRSTDPVYLILRRDRYERVGDVLGGYARVLATVQMEATPDRHDWLIITNAPRVTSVP